jgi:hypothetical protein
VGVERVAQESDHYIHLYQPELVSQAIRDVVTKAQSSKRLWK